MEHLKKLREGLPSWCQNATAAFGQRCRWHCLLIVSTDYIAAGPFPMCVSVQCECCISRFLCFDTPDRHSQIPLCFMADSPGNVEGAEGATAASPAAVAGGPALGRPRARNLSELLSASLSNQPISKPPPRRPTKPFSRSAHAPWPLCSKTCPAATAWSCQIRWPSWRHQHSYAEGPLVLPGQAVRRWLGPSPDIALAMQQPLALRVP